MAITGRERGAQAGGVGQGPWPLYKASGEATRAAQVQQPAQCPVVAAVLSAPCSGPSCCCFSPAGVPCSAPVSGGLQAVHQGRPDTLRGLPHVGSPPRPSRLCGLAVGTLMNGNGRRSQAREASPRSVAAPHLPGPRGSYSGPGCPGEVGPALPPDCETVLWLPHTCRGPGLRRRPRSLAQPVGIRGDGQSPPQ